MATRQRGQILAASLFLIVVLVLTRTFEMTVVRGNSMVPTYRDGQVLWINRLYRLTGPLHRGDVVVIQKGSDVLIKRIAYLGGEKIPDRETERYLQARIYFDVTPRGAPPEQQRLVVPKDQVVILGDNPPVSEDSRMFGPIPVEYIRGRVLGAPPKP